MEILVLVIPAAIAGMYAVSFAGWLIERAWKRLR